jgi:hypothetical protein
VVDDGDLLIRDERVAQVLRMQLANNSSVRKAQDSTHSLADLDKSKQGTPDALDLSQKDWVASSNVGGAYGTAARHGAVASLALAVDVEGLELADQVISQVLGAIAARDLLVLAVFAC